MNRQICKTVLGSFIGAVFIAVAPITAEAQVGQITGTVRDQDTGGPLATVQVYLQGTSRGTLTDQNGRFVLGDVPPGSYTLNAQRIGGLRRLARIQRRTPRHVERRRRGRQDPGARTKR